MFENMALSNMSAMTSLYLTRYNKKVRNIYAYLF